MIVLASWLGWQIVGNTMADTNAIADPESALAWRPQMSTALIGLAGQYFAASDGEPDLTQVEELARRAMVSDPLEDRAIRMLGLTAARAGDIDRAERLMELASRRSLRDAPVQAWLFDRRARLGDFDGALYHADALLRTRRGVRDDIGPMLLAFAIDPEAQSALIGSLANDPPWRGWFLDLVSRQVDNPGIAWEIFSALEESARPPRDSELRTYLGGLVKAGLYEDAYLSWLQFLPSERRGNVSFAYNGDFEQPLSGVPFDWIVSRVRGASTEIVDSGRAGAGKALRIVFANTRVAYRHVSKWMLLPPGRYQLSGDVRAEQLETERGMIWRVTCAEDEKHGIGESAPIVGTVAWQSFTMDFEVPQTGCRAQRLRLELAARAAIETEIGGEVWYDQIEVRRESTN